MNAPVLKKQLAPPTFPLPGHVAEFESATRFALSHIASKSQSPGKSLPSKCQRQRCEENPETISLRPEIELVLPAAGNRFPVAVANDSTNLLVLVKI